MIRKLFHDSGYLIVETEHDTTNIVCRHGHIYADGDYLFAALYNGSRSQRRNLRKLGEPTMDGDFGELTVRFHPDRFRDVARLMKPRQRDLHQVKVA